MMIKQFSHKATSFLLAFLVLFSTVSFAVEKHFCGNILIDTAVFKEIKQCCPAPAKTQDSDKKGCCKNELEIVKGQEDMKFSKFEDLNFEQQFFIESFVYSFVNLFEDLPQHIIPHKDYSPPILVKDIHVIDQIFLI